jgi:hypothetical protein
VPIPKEEEEEVERDHGYILAWPGHLVLLPGQVINFFTKLVNKGFKNRKTFRTIFRSTIRFNFCKK